MDEIEPARCAQCGRMPATYLKSVPERAKVWCSGAGLHALIIHPAGEWNLRMKEMILAGR